MLHDTDRSAGKRIVVNEHSKLALLPPAQNGRCREQLPVATQLIAYGRIFITLGETATMRRRRAKAGALTAVNPFAP
ncbi:MAG: hypothetical protein IPQ01_07290 [Zoogloea sp.]|nr:hypothetical protein [Zoogloea sp.]